MINCDGHFLKKWSHFKLKEKTCFAVLSFQNLFLIRQKKCFGRKKSQCLSKTIKAKSTNKKVMFFEQEKIENITVYLNESSFF